MLNPLYAPRPSLDRKICEHFTMRVMPLLFSVLIRQRFFLCLKEVFSAVRVWSLQQEVAIANRCQPRGAKRVGVQVPPFLQRSRKVPKWHPPPELVGTFRPGLPDCYISSLSCHGRWSLSFPRLNIQWLTDEKNKTTHPTTRIPCPASCSTKHELKSLAGRTD